MCDGQAAGIHGAAVRHTGPVDAGHGDEQPQARQAAPKPRCWARSTSRTGRPSISGPTSPMAPPGTPATCAASVLSARAASRCPAPSCRSGRPTPTASTTCSTRDWTQHRCARQAARRPPRAASTFAQRAWPAPYTGGPPTAPCGKHAAGAGPAPVAAGAPAFHDQPRPGYQTPHHAHLPQRDDRYLDSATPCSACAAHWWPTGCAHEPGTTPDGGHCRAHGPFYTLDFDFVLETRAAA